MATIEGAQANLHVSVQANLHVSVQADLHVSVQAGDEVGSLEVGKILVRDGEVLVADEAAVRAAAQVQAQKVARRRSGAQGDGTAGSDGSMTAVRGFQVGTKVVPIKRDRI